jgi:hypothetical protein
VRGIGDDVISKNIIVLLLLNSISLGYSMETETLESLQKQRTERLRERFDLAKKKVISDDDILEKETTKDTVYSKWEKSAEIAAASWGMSFDDYLKAAKTIVSQNSNSYKGPKSYLDLIPMINPYSEIKENSKEFESLKILCANLKNEVSKEELDVLMQQQQQNFPKFTIPM